MFKTGVRSNVPIRSLLLLAAVILAPALARADDFSWAGDSSCSDPPIFSDIFSLPATNSSGGLCRAFGNHTGHTINSLTFTTTYQSSNPDFFCSAAPYFTNCDFNVDGTIYHNGDAPPSGGSTITIDFFGTNTDNRRGIPVDTTTGCTDTSTDPACYNFYINLNSYLNSDGRPCNPLTVGGCTQPTGTGGSGNWGHGVVIGGVANVPEPRTGAFVLTALGVLLARIRTGKRGRR
jgi:hypothetical protein